MKLRTFRIGGIHPEENKLSSEVVTTVAKLPQQAIFPLSQHIGAPAKPVVKKGDKVKVGTLIAEAGGFVSAPIFSSVSGTVLKVESAIDATGYRKPSIIIKVEGDEWEEVLTVLISWNFFQLIRSLRLKRLLSVLRKPELQVWVEPVSLHL